MNLLIKRLMFWIRESTLRAKFRLYERWPALFPHALDIDEQYEEDVYKRQGLWLRCPR